MFDQLTIYILASTVVVAVYFFVTRSFREVSKKMLLRAEKHRDKLLGEKFLPPVVKKTIAHDPIIDNWRDFSPWVVAAVVLPAGLAVLFSNNSYEKDLAGMTDQGRASYSGFIDCTIMGTVLRSPLAALIILLEFAVVGAAMIVVSRSIKGVNPLLLKMAAPSEAGHLHIGHNTGNPA